MDGSYSTGGVFIIKAFLEVRSVVQAVPSQDLVPPEVVPGVSVGGECPCGDQGHLEGYFIGSKYLQEVPGGWVLSAGSCVRLAGIQSSR